jgi:hypothetical protein
MHVLEDIDLLTAWEKGRLASSVAGSSLALLAAAYPGEPMASLARLTIGERDALLFTLRERLFGSHIQGLLNCSVCRETLSIELEISDLRLEMKGPWSTALHLHDEHYRLEFRLPNSRDLLSITSGSSVDSVRRQLFERILLSAARAGKPITADEVPEDILARAESMMAAADPQADIQFNIVCSTCQRSHQTAFDIASFLWAEVEAWAVRILREIHELARSYGWCEEEILRMSPWRRNCYMEMLGL